MANNKLFYRGEHKQHGHSGLAFHNVGIHNIVGDIKRPDKMAEIKMILSFIGHMLGIPITVIGIVSNWDNAGKLIPIFLSAVYLIVFINFKWKRNKQILREKEYELWHKEIDKMERQADYNKKNGK